MGKPIRTYARHQNATPSLIPTASSSTLGRYLSEKEPSVASIHVEALTTCKPEEHLRVKQPPVLLTAAHLSVAKPSSYDCPSPFPFSPYSSPDTAGETGGGRVQSEWTLTAEQSKEMRNWSFKMKKKIKGERQESQEILSKRNEMRLKSCLFL